MKQGDDVKYVQINGDLHRRLKMLSVAEDRSMRELASEAVMKFLERASRSSGETREPQGRYSEKRSHRRTNTNDRT